MANGVHINTARMMLNAGDPVDIVLWTKSGCLQRWKNAISISYNKETDTRKMRLMDSREIRQCRDCLIMSINNLEIFL